MRQLRDNAQRLSESEIVALCDEVIKSRPKTGAGKSVKVAAVKVPAKRRAAASASPPSSAAASRSGSTTSSPTRFRNPRNVRYTVFVGGKRIGATVSVPTESDAREAADRAAAQDLQQLAGPPEERRPPPGTAETAHAPRESLPLDVWLGGIRATTDR